MSHWHISQIELILCIPFDRFGRLCKVNLYTSIFVEPATHSTQFNDEQRESHLLFSFITIATRLATGGENNIHAKRSMAVTSKSMMVISVTNTHRKSERERVEINAFKKNTRLHDTWHECDDVKRENSIDWCVECKMKRSNKIYTVKLIDMWLLKMFVQRRCCWCVWTCVLVHDKNRHTSLKDSWLLQCEN